VWQGSAGDRGPYADQTGLWEASVEVVPGKWLPTRKLSLNAEHGAAAISVRRPETDLVPGGSRSGFGIRGTMKWTHPNRLIEVQFCL